jgi:hypothetical protein
MEKLKFSSSDKWQETFKIVTFQIHIKLIFTERSDMTEETYVENVQRVYHNWGHDEIA